MALHMPEPAHLPRPPYQPLQPASDLPSLPAVVAHCKRLVARDIAIPASLVQLAW
ncbi:uncharacterized protein BDR25DRAFT_351611 [Lindgomyces ingoldianus]|uniref:Uncharacterized protein n=1 Tax=Lindgomyces ingoldianus TaxID=673940 RepID=A0ACB6R4H3_9PLEO|nr:uncharacterized protein BDR25DRAFT_351611 [Lindgomyces ingoldianus]KAF2474076.1 hypothetical protein BDR25DRAFT_351611 [Lindgomyces ingoldianus]